MHKLPFTLTGIFTILSCLLILSTGCNTYYKAISRPEAGHPPTGRLLDSLQKASRVLVLRDSTAGYYIREQNINTDSQYIEWTVDTLSWLHQWHLHQGRGGKMKYFKQYPEQVSVLKEVHVYLRYGMHPVLGKQAVAWQDIRKIEIIEKDLKRTANSKVTGYLIVAGSLGILTFTAYYFGLKSAFGNRIIR